MKKISLLFLLIFPIVNTASSRARIFDAERNVYSDNPAQHIDQRNDANASAASVAIDCGIGGKFWTVTTPTGSILEWQLTDTTVTFLDTLFVTSPVVSLSYCNLMNMGSISTTLYGSEITTVSWYDGASWTSITPAQEYSNSGGCGRFLYFMRAESSGSKHLDRYNGASFTNVVALQNAQFGVADIAVDTGGKIWAFASKVEIGDTLIAFDSLGNVVKWYNISPPIDENNAYGCFLMDSTLYIGIGNANTTYPNTIIPIRIYADTAIEGNPISFVNGNFVDMSSCTEPLVLAIQNYTDAHAINLYPNPVRNELIITAPMTENMKNINIYNVLGEKLYPPKQEAINDKSEAVIDVSTFSAGIYFLQLTTDEETLVRKFVKE